MLGYKYKKQDSPNATWYENDVDKNNAVNYFRSKGLPFGTRHFGTKLEIDEKNAIQLDRNIQLLKTLKDKNFLENYDSIKIIEILKHSIGTITSPDDIKEFENIGIKISEKSKLYIEKLFSEKISDRLSEDDLAEQIPPETYRIFSKLYPFSKSFYAYTDIASRIVTSECLASLIKDNITEFEKEVGYSIEELKVWFSEDEIDHMLLTHEIESTYTIDEFENAGANFSNVPEGKIKLDKDGNIDRTQRYTYKQILEMGKNVYDKIDNSKLTKEPDKIDRKAIVRDMIYEKTPLFEMEYMKSSEEYLNAIDRLNEIEQNIDFNGNSRSDIFPGLYGAVGDVIDCIDMAKFADAIEKGALFHKNGINLINFDAVGVNWKKEPFNISDWYSTTQASNLQEEFLIEFLKDILVKMYPQKDNLKFDDLRKAYFIADLIRTSSFERETGINIGSLKKSGLEQSEIEKFTSEYSGKRTDRKSFIKEKIGRTISPDEFLASANNPEVTKKSLQAREVLAAVVAKEKPDRENPKDGT